MANFVYNLAAKMGWNGEINWGSDTIRIMLIDADYTPDRDHDYVGSGAGTPGGEEITATNYTGGHQGAGRHVISNLAITEVDASDLAKTDGDDPSIWSNLGGAVNDTIQGAIFMRDGTSDDSDALLLAWYDTVSGTPIFPYTTTGGDYTLAFAAAGIINLLTNP
jgi:hypothetical protein